MSIKENVTKPTWQMSRGTVKSLDCEMAGKCQHPWQGQEPQTQRQPAQNKSFAEVLSWKQLGKAEGTQRHILACAMKISELHIASVSTADEDAKDFWPQHQLGPAVSLKRCKDSCCLFCSR